MGRIIMLYQIGPIAMDTFPFNADDMKRDGKASHPKKAVMGTLPPAEFTGDDGSTITISGQLLPIKTGGLSSLDALDQLRATGAHVPVVRGDGKVLGWFAITGVSESHKELLRNGVGFVVTYSVTLMQVPSPALGASGPAGLVATLIDLFSVGE